MTLIILEREKKKNELSQFHKQVKSFYAQKNNIVVRITTNFEIKKKKKNY